MDKFFLKCGAGPGWARVRGRQCGGWLVERVKRLAVQAWMGGGGCAMFLFAVLALPGCALLPLDDALPPKRQSVVPRGEPVVVEVERLMFTRGYSLWFRHEGEAAEGRVTVRAVNAGAVPLSVGRGTSITRWDASFLKPGEGVDVYAGRAGEFFGKWRFAVQAPEWGRSVLRLEVVPVSGDFRGGRVVVFSKETPHGVF